MRLKKPRSKAANNVTTKDKDEETASLMAGDSDESSTAKQSKEISSSLSHWQKILGVILIVCVAFLVWDRQDYDATSGDILLKTKVQRTTSPPLSSAKLMLERLQQIRQEWVDQKLKADYGEQAYLDIFEPIDDTTGGRVNVGKHRAFVDVNKLPRRGRNYDDYKNSEGPAWGRMVRKWTIKLLQLQIAMLEEPETSSDDDANANDNLYGTFVWANGGHSASAGHGNFFQDSYTQVLERDLQPTLKGIGLDFRVRNYAMGGVASGEEVAMCFNSIFGKDIDAITWDYGMTDGNDYHNIVLYLYNAARLAMVEDEVTQPGNIRRRPSLTLLHNSGDYMTELLQIMQDLGMNMLVMDDKFQKEKMYPGFPDMFGMTDAQIADTPPFIQYFKCNNMIEAGDPGCADNKFNMTMCTERNGRNTWHPGWRYHALLGHTMAMTVFELLTEALKNLVELEPAEEETPQQRHTRLMKQLVEEDRIEQAHYEHIFRQPVTMELKMVFEEYFWKGDLMEQNKEAMKDFRFIEKLTNEGAFCHTALLPAEMRYRGLLTNNPNETGTILDEGYEHSVRLSEIWKFESPQEEGKQASVFVSPYKGREDHMVLGTTDDEYDECEEITNRDYKDFFYVSSQEGWRTVTFPNDAQKNYYTEFNMENIEGWIFACMTNCPWGDCDGGDVRSSVVDGSFDAKEFGRVEMEVNGVGVTDAKCFSKCCALRHADPDPKKRFRFTPNQEGKFVLRARITGATKYSFARFSSFLVA